MRPLTPTSKTGIGRRHTLPRFHPVGPTANPFSNQTTLFWPPREQPGLLLGTRERARARARRPHGGSPEGDPTLPVGMPIRANGPLSYRSHLPSLLRTQVGGGPLVRGGRRQEAPEELRPVGASPVRVRPSWAGSSKLGVWLPKLAFPVRVRPLYRGKLGRWSPP